MLRKLDPIIEARHLRGTYWMMRHKVRNSRKPNKKISTSTKQTNGNQTKEKRSRPPRNLFTNTKLAESDVDEDESEEEEAVEDDEERVVKTIAGIVELANDGDDEDDDDDDEEEEEEEELDDEEEIELRFSKQVQSDA